MKNTIKNTINVIEKRELRKRQIWILGGFSLLLVLLTGIIFPNFSAVLAQASKGTAGFSSGSGNTTTSGTTFSTPSLPGNPPLSNVITNETPTTTTTTTTTNETPTSTTTISNEPQLTTVQSLTPQQSQQITAEVTTLQQASRPEQILANTITTSIPSLPIEVAPTQAFETYLGLPPSPSPSQNIQQVTGFIQQVVTFNQIKPSLIYLNQLSPTSAQIAPNHQDTWVASASTNLAQLSDQPSDQQLQFLAVTSQGALPAGQIPGVDYRQLLRTVRQFEQNLSNKRQDSSYLTQASQLYEWLITPIEAQLKQQKIDNLIFVLPSGLRTLPLAALYNAKTQRFLVEDYTLGMIPSLSLIDLTPKPYRQPDQSKVVAMGSSTFADNTPLPAVPLELAEVTKIFPGESFLDQEFTVSNLQKALDSKEFNVVHLATHGVFRPGDRRNSYIYLNQGKLNLDQFADLGFDQSKIDLLVLSACKTAFGDPDAELGFAGLAVKAGVRTALGSLWNVSDEGTLALMTLFYHQFKAQRTKTEALHQAQLAMLKGNYQVVNDQLILENQASFSISPAIAEVFKKDLRHPYYWSGFTLIGNPW
jgi:CHAT domain-containing protein